MTFYNGLLIAMTAGVVLTAVAILYAEYKPALREFRFKAQPLMQTGDSSLSPRSINWLAATALSAALFICFGLM